MVQCDAAIRRQFQVCVPVFILIGPAGSGKSTYAKVLQEKYAAEIYNADAIREELFGKDYDYTKDENKDKHNKKVFGTLYSRAKGDVVIGCPIILDNTNLNAKQRKKAMNAFRNFNVRFVAVVIDTPIEECKRRNAARDRVVPDYAIDRMFKFYQKPTYDEGFFEIRYVGD